MPSPKSPKVLVFGVTGEVGSRVAIEASSRGAEVWLGMRDVEKTSQWLSADDEVKYGMARVHADLSDPDSLLAAVQASGAKSVYIYSCNSRDAMKSSLGALKQAGIKHTVFLSTATVRGEIRAIPRDFFIPWSHAQVEVSLEDLDMPHTAVRPGYFASNPFRLYLDASKTNAKIFAPEQLHDPIDPNDIGRVCAVALVSPDSTSKKQVYFLCGPERLSQRSQWDIVNLALAKSGKPEVSVVEMNLEQYRAELASRGVPKFVADSLAQSMADTSLLYRDNDFLPASKNVEKLTGRVPTKFEDYVAAELSRYFGE